MVLLINKYVFRMYINWYSCYIPKEVSNFELEQILHFELKVAKQFNLKCGIVLPFEIIADILKKKQQLY